MKKKIYNRSFQYLNKIKKDEIRLYTKFMNIISDEFNIFFKKNYLKRYWEVIIGNWLILFIRNFNKERYRIKPKIFSKKVSSYYFSDYNDFNQKFNDNEFRNFFFKGINAHAVKKFEFLNKIKMLLSRFFLILINKPNEIQIVEGFQNNLYEKILMRFLSFKMIDSYKVDVDYFGRGLLKKKILLNCSNQRERIFANLLINCMPKTYIELFREFENEIKKNKLDYEKIVSSHAFITSDIFKYLLAYNTLKMSKIGAYQHGSNFFIKKNDLNFIHHERIFDFFIVWGDFLLKYKKKKIKVHKINKKAYGNFSSLNNFKKSKLEKKNNPILILQDYFILDSMYEESTRSITVQLNQKIISFFKNIQTPCNISIYGSEKEIKKKDSIFDNSIIKQFTRNSNKIFYSNYNYNHRLMNSDYALFTYFGTGYLELLSINYPVILILDKKTHNEYTKEFLSEIKKKNYKNLIFFSFNDFANFVKKKNYINFWYHKKTQLNIKKLQKKFCIR